MASACTYTRIPQVDAALFEPPPFQPAKLSVRFLQPRSAAVSGDSGNLAAQQQQQHQQHPQQQQLHQQRHQQQQEEQRPRRYTLTHNDITGALTLSIGSEYNQQQVQGFYTRILRDEITAEWFFGSGGSSSSAAGSAHAYAFTAAGGGADAAAAPAATAPATQAAATAAAAAAAPELHIYCHVSGEERWLAPPQLRNFIFRREMTLVSIVCHVCPSVRASGAPRSWWLVGCCLFGCCVWGGMLFGVRASWPGCTCAACVSHLPVCHTQTDTHSARAPTNTCTAFVAPHAHVTRTRCWTRSCMVTRPS
jgi:hypothetical protein